MTTTKNREIIKLLIGNKNKIFNVTFVKKDGTVRSFNAIHRAKNKTKGGTLKYNPADYNLISVWSLNDSGFRMINTETIIRIKANKITTYFNTI